MDHFSYQNGQLCAEEVELAQIAAEYGTPCYVYSRATLERHWRAFDDVFAGHDHLICYAVKANSNLAVLNLFARLGSGFDIVSVGELERVIAAGGDPSKVIFSGVAKTAAEMRRALEVEILCFNVESEAELDRLNSVAAEMGVLAPASLRVNPDVDAQTHPYISTGLKENKFGIDITVAPTVCARATAMSNINLIGIDCHIGSQLTDAAPFTAACDRLLLLLEALATLGIEIHHLDLGGGLGITYNDETPPSPAVYANALLSKLGGRGFTIILEPGRAIAGNAGVMLTEVEYLKGNDYKNFAIVDAGMNDLLRPSLYGAWQAIIPLQQGSKAEAKTYDIVGPVCETGDFIGKERELALEQGDLLAVRSSGAYGFSMSSTYNSRPRCAEVMVDGDKSFLVRRRETVEELYRGESILPD
ncbi:MAG: diaminopimelate decarboxylase [Thiotrichaceae bacterium]|nr:diaminopimelate decarboxylase [Thiotrichaceae bacterium]PCI12803.1 MAG: diaminopimelate decarboxylase [Thiotrichales bacterium]